MKSGLVFISAVLLALLVTGCGSFEPPERPVAYIFPTVRSFDSVGNLKGHDVQVEDVQRWLARSGIYDDLRGSGMTEDDWSLLVRGLKKTGYSELDARKTDLPIRWVSISFLDDARTEVMIGYSHDGGRVMRAGMVWQERILEELRKRCEMPGIYVSDAWFGRTGTTEREFIEMSSYDTGRPVLWIKRLVFSEAAASKEGA